MEEIESERGGYVVPHSLDLDSEDNLIPQVSREKLSAVVEVGSESRKRELRRRSREFLVMARRAT